MAFLGVEWGATYELLGPIEHERVNLIVNSSMEVLEGSLVKGYTTQASGWTESSFTQVTTAWEKSTRGHSELIKAKKDNTATNRFITFTQFSGDALSDTIYGTDVSIVPGRAYDFIIPVNVIDASSKGVKMVLTWQDASPTSISSISTAFFTGTGVKTFELLNQVAPPEAAAFTLALVVESNVANDTLEILTDNWLAQLHESTQTYFDGKSAASYFVGKDDESYSVTYVRSRVVFNNASDPDFVGILSPESSGLDSPEVREDSADRVEADGAVFGDFYAGKRPVILQGTIIANSPTQRNERVGKLLAATNALRQNASLRWKPQGATEEIELKLRRQQPVRITKGYVKDFQASMVAERSGLESGTVQSVKGSTPGVGLKTLEQAPGEVTSEGPGTFKWTSPENAKVSDNVYASINPTSTATNDTLIAKKFELSKKIPASALILGFQRKIEIKKEGAAGELGTAVEQLVLPTTTYTFQQLEFWPTVETVKTYPVAAPEMFMNAESQAFFEDPTALENLEYKVRTMIFGPESIKGLVDQIKIVVKYRERIVLEVNNEGVVNANPILRVYGPIGAVGQTWSIVNLTTGQRLTYNGVLENVARWVEFDVANNTATLYGEITGPRDVYGEVAFPTEWPFLQPGINKLVLEGDTGGTTTNLEVRWRNTWA